MISAINDNIYDMTLISKVKERTGPKRLRKITRNLKNLSKEDVKKFSELNIKIFETEKEEKKTVEFQISAPIIGAKHYIKQLKKSNPKPIINNYKGHEGENTLYVVDDNEEVKQIDSSDLSDDE